MAIPARAPRLTAYRFPRFVETAAIWYPARAHLYTPIALGDHLTVKSFEDLLRDIRNKLMWGGLYYYLGAAHPHPTITQHMFPFTPVELHRGWLLGEERLITCVPGTTLGDEDPVTVYWYGADGALTDRSGEQRVEDGRRLLRLDLAAGGWRSSSATDPAGAGKVALRPTSTGAEAAARRASASALPERRSACCLRSAARALTCCGVYSRLLACVA